MDITTFTNLFSGAPFKPLLQHRDEVLRSLRFLSQQLQGVYVPHYPLQQWPEWMHDTSHQLKSLEQEIIAKLQKPFIMALPRGLVISRLHTQNNLANIVYRLAERLSYYPMALPENLQGVMARLCRNFGKAVNQLCQGTAQLDALSRAGFRKKHSGLLDRTCQQLAVYVHEITLDSAALRKKIYIQDNVQDGVMETLDVALLFMTLDDIGELTLLMGSMVNQQQPHN